MFGLTGHKKVDYLYTDRVRMEYGFVWDYLSFCGLFARELATDNIFRRVLRDFFCRFEENGAGKKTLGYSRRKVLYYQNVGVARRVYASALLRHDSQNKYVQTFG